MEQYDYDAFGQPYFYDATGTATYVNGQPGSPFGNRFLFTGREWLSDLKLYDYRNRMYQPELGRFLQPDPKEFAAGDYNLYRYCHNDPVNRSDPFGLVDIDISPQLDALGIKASDNSLAAAKDGYPRSQLIQSTNGQLSLQNKINQAVAVKQQQFNRLAPSVMMEERAKPDEGSTAAGKGHVHMDKTGRPAPSDSDFSKKDYAEARGDAKKGLIGLPIYKVNQSDPSRVDRLTPQKDPNDKPTIVRVR
jgi:RHS repeat-associated protein